MKKKVILAYSGGLDTSVILKWLKGKGFDVIAYIANVGQLEDFKSVEEKAYATGASKVYVEDLRKEFVTDYIFPAMQGNAIYEGTYLLGTAIARPLITKRQIEIARAEGTEYVSHGSTGKGNDQIRFEFAYYALMPNVKIISPWKEPEFLEQFKGRTDLLEYAEKYNIPVKASKSKNYSEDDNLLHVSHESGILEDPKKKCPENVYSMSVSPKNAPDAETVIEIHFKNGIPVKVINKNDGTIKEDPLELFIYLNELGGNNGIGRIDIVENRFIGIKSRGVYETPCGTILWKAHRDIEGIAMDKEVMHLRDSLIPKFASIIYNGLWFSPEMDFIMCAFNKSQERIDGVVTLSLYKGNVDVIGRYSPTSLYDQELVSMEVEGDYDATDCKGFIKISSIRLKAHNVVLKNSTPYKWRKDDNNEVN